MLDFSKVCKEIYTIDYNRMMRVIVVVCVDLLKPNIKQERVFSSDLVSNVFDNSCF